MLNSMKIGMKLALGFGLLVVLVCIMTAVGYWSSNTISTATFTMLKGDAVIAQEASKLRAHILKRIASMTGNGAEP